MNSHGRSGPTVKKARSRSSHLEEKLMAQLMRAGVTRPTREFVFAPGRKWRADFCWEEQRLLVEVEGGVFSGGRHVSPMGFLADIEKYNTACLLGYRLIRVGAKHINSHAALNWIRSALAQEPPPTPKPRPRPPRKLPVGDPSPALVAARSALDGLIEFHPTGS